MFKGFKSKASDATRKAQRKAGSVPTPEFLNDRYGADNLNRFLVIGALVLFVLALVPKLHFLTWIGLIAIGYGFFRMFSRNSAKRMSENRAFLSLKRKIAGKATRTPAGEQAKGSAKDAQADERVTLSCPECGQRIRVPKVTGTIRVICPKCRHEFYRKG